MPKDSAPKIDFLLRDRAIFALAKPACSHSVLNTAGSKFALAAALLGRYPSLASAAEKEGDAGLVQRLDFETSGVILGAWTRSAWRALRQALDTGGVKEYLLVVEGRFPKQKQVSGFIGAKGRASKKVRFAQREFPRSTFAKTTFFLETFSPKSGRSLVRAVTSTGARHQIRVSAASIGFPLLGDALYGASPLSPDAGLPGFFLHAVSVTLPHISTKKTLTIEAPVPKYLRRFVEG